MSHTHTVSDFTLESGVTLRDVPVSFRTWGQLNERRDNAVVVCHALTGNTDVADWWGALLGPDRALDPQRDFVICMNVLASPYGTASPLTYDPEAGQRYGPNFPHVTIRDTVRLHRRVLEHLGVQRVAMAVGGSMGGMQVLEWAFFGDFVQSLAPIAVGGQHAPWQIGWSEAQRQAIYADANWHDGNYSDDAPPRKGLAAARAMAMVSYRSYDSYAERFKRSREDPGDSDNPPRFAVESYLQYQGAKLTDRFDANCYVRLTQQMDTHDVSRGRGPYDEVLRTIQQPTLVVGIDSDVLYPLQEQEELAEALPHATLNVLHAPHGHDAFLIEDEALNDLLLTWRTRHTTMPSCSCPA